MWNIWKSEANTLNDLIWKRNQSLQTYLPLRDRFNNDHLGKLTLSSTHSSRTDFIRSYLVKKRINEIVYHQVTHIFLFVNVYVNNIMWFLWVYLPKRWSLPFCYECCQLEIKKMEVSLYWWIVSKIQKFCLEKKGVRRLVIS